VHCLVPLSAVPRRGGMVSSRALREHGATVRATGYRRDVHHDGSPRAGGIHRR
jgi:hypothetical protein